MREMKCFLVGLAMLPGFAHAADCAGIGRQGPQPLRPTVLLPVAAELSAPSYQLGAHSGVLAHAYDESQSVDQVLLRLRIEGCRNVAMAVPVPTPVPNAIEPVEPVDPKDPSVYKPKTEFDNTPWRFNMQQNGKQMTADEFDAWMKSRGVRVVRARAPAPEVPVSPDATPAAPGAGLPPGTVPPEVAPAPPVAPSLAVPPGSVEAGAAVPAATTATQAPTDAVPSEPSTSEQEDAGNDDTPPGQ